MSNPEDYLYCSNCHAGTHWSDMDYGRQCRNCHVVPASWLLYQPPGLDPAEDIGN